MPQNRLFIGIDDTDSLTSKGTGEITKSLAKQIESNNLGKVVNITRHQLFLSKKIKYTNINNSACLEVTSCDFEKLFSFCKEFITENCQKCSNTAIVFSDSNNISNDIVEFSLKSKKEIVSINEAVMLIKNNNLNVTFLNNNKKKGIIGALAAIGLRSTNNDGRVIWANGFEVPQMRGTYIAGEVYYQTHVDTIKTLDGYKIPTGSTIIYENKLSKPILENNVVTLLVEEIKEKRINSNELMGAFSSNFKILVN